MWTRERNSISIPHSIHHPKRLCVGGRQTEHVAALVLPASLISDIGLNAKVNKRQVLDGIFAGINAPDDTEPLAIIHAIAELAEFNAQSGKRKIGRAQVISVQSKACRAEI